MALDVLGRFAILAILWGASFLMVLRVVDAFGWIGAVSIRSLIASALLLIIAKAMRRKLDFSIGYFPFLVLGVTMVAMQLIGLSFAVPRIGTAMTAILVGAIPLFTSVIGRLMGIEQMSRHGIVGLVIGFIGIVLLVGFPSGEVTARFAIGVVVCTVGCIAAAFASNYSKMRMSEVGSWEQVIGAFFFGGVVTAPLLIFVPFRRVPLLGDWFNIALLAALCSSLCYVIYFKLVARLGATKAISVEFLVTVVAVLIGALYLHESISLIQLLGGALVILGCTLILSLFSRRVDSR
jgi:drug/metabolite transporter (DMT)-like permease